LRQKQKETFFWFWKKVGIKNNTLHLAAMTTISKSIEIFLFCFVQISAKKKNFHLDFDWGLMHVLQRVFQRLWQLPLEYLSTTRVKLILDHFQVYMYVRSKIAALTQISESTTGQGR
jgi:hypothetical protein